MNPAPSNAGNVPGVDGAVTVVGATHFVVSNPASAAAGSPANFTVTALDQFNNIAASYAGTIHFTSSDILATLPADATLTNGAGVFGIIFGTAGNQTLTATDTVNGVTGVSTAVAVSAAAASQFTVSARRPCCSAAPSSSRSRRWIHLATWPPATRARSTSAAAMLPPPCLPMPP